MVGQYNEAYALMRSLAAEDTSNVDYRGALGVLAARRGNGAEAARLDTWLAARRGPYLRGAPTMYRAEIAAVLGDPDRALALLRDAIAQGLLRWGAWAGR